METRRLEVISRWPGDYGQNASHHFFALSERRMGGTGFHSRSRASLPVPMFDRDYSRAASWYSERRYPGLLGEEDGCGG